MSGGIPEEEVKAIAYELSRRYGAPQLSGLGPSGEAETLLFENEQEKQEAEALSADLDRRLAEALAKSEELLRSMDQRFGT